MAALTHSASTQLSKYHNKDVCSFGTSLSTPCLSRFLSPTVTFQYSSPSDSPTLRRAYYSPASSRSTGIPPSSKMSCSLAAHLLGLPSSKSADLQEWTSLSTPPSPLIAPSDLCQVGGLKRKEESHTPRPSSPDTPPDQTRRYLYGEQQPQAEDSSQETSSILRVLQELRLTLKDKAALPSEEIPQSVED